MRRFVLWSIVALQLVLMVSEPCVAKRRGYGRARRRDELRVRFGVDDVDNRYPYVVSIRRGNWRCCTGTLIAPDWVLTAAHCTDVTHVRFGNMTMKRNEEYTRKVKKNIPHPRQRLLGYPEYKYSNDIALLQIDPIYLKYYCNVSSLNYRSLYGYPVEYAGFGHTAISSDEDYIEVYDQDKVRPLQLGEGVVIPCASDTFSEPHICVAPKCSNNMRDTLGGDSGGPLFYDGKIVGILNGGDRPPVSSYAPVSTYLDWIHDTLRQR